MSCARVLFRTRRARVTYTCARRTLNREQQRQAAAALFTSWCVRAGFNDCSDKNVNTHKRSARRRRRLRRGYDDDDDDDEGRRLRLRVPRTRKSRGHRSGPDRGGRVDPVSREDGRTRAPVDSSDGCCCDGERARVAGYPARGRVRTHTRARARGIIIIMCVNVATIAAVFTYLFTADRGRSVEEL